MSEWSLDFDSVKEIYDENERLRKENEDLINRLYEKVDLESIETLLIYKEMFIDLMKVLDKKMFDINRALDEMEGGFPWD